MSLAGLTHCSALVASRTWWKPLIVISLSIQAAESPSNPPRKLRLTCIILHYPDWSPSDGAPFVTSAASVLAAGHLKVVVAATEPLTERPATEFPEGITACSLSADASGWLAAHALQAQDANAGRPLANGAVADDAATSGDCFVLVARYTWAASI
jgi:hypothetical protein